MLVKNGALVLAVNNPKPILQAIPTAKEINYKGKKLVAVKHTLDSAKILRNLGLNAPSPILYDGFTFSGRYTPMGHQVKTAEFLTLYRKAYVFNTMGCVDSDSEYLSPTGWRKISEYDGGMVAQFSKVNRIMTFVYPTEYIKKPCAEMIRFKNTRGVDQLLSAEHRVLYESSTKKLMVDSAQNIMYKDRKSKKGWSGKFLTTFTPKLDSKLPISSAEIRLMVAVIADGHFSSPTTNHCVIRLKKDRKIKRLRAILDYMNIDYKERFDTSETGYGFTVFSFYSPRKEKDFAAWWAASPEQLKIIVNEVFNWDGSERKADASDFSTYIRASADFIQYACAACGRTASLSKFTRGRRGAIEIEYVVHAREGAATPGIIGVTSTGKKIQNINYEASTDGFKYCFSVPDTFWVMRRNGNIVITGNTGKTAAALWATEYLRARGIVKNILVICPLSVMDVWTSEIFSVLPHWSSTQLIGKRERRVDLLEDTNFGIINYDGLVSIQKEVAKWNPDLVIVDEASAYCNPRTKRHAALRAILRPTARLWMLTGTPIANAPTDAYGLIKLINPSCIPPSFKLFQETLMRKFGPYKWVPRAGAEAKVFELMQPAIRFSKKDCLDLPPITFNHRRCEMSKKQLEVFVDVKSEMKHEDQESGSEIKAVNAAVKLIKLQQIMCGVVKDTDGNPLELDPKERLELIKELVSEAEAKVIIFVPFIHAMHLVQNYLAKDYQTELVNGAVSKANRDDIFRRFQQDDKLKVLIAHPKVAAHGLNLTAANTIIWYAPIFSIDQYTQANARIERTGQKLSMSIYNISCHPVETAIYALLRARESLQARVLDLYDTALA